MDKNKVYDIFFDQDIIKFSKGYKEFEEVYEELKDKLKLTREERESIGHIEVIVRKEK